MITTLTKESHLKSLQGLNLHVLIAQYWYSKHSSSASFWTDLNHYLFEGQVLSTPEVFVMGKHVLIDGEPAFFVRYAGGKLEELSKHIPQETRWIAFCRNNHGAVRKYSIDRLQELSRMIPLTSPIFSMHNVLEVGRNCSAA